jgi:hypothetical protein
MSKTLTVVMTNGDKLTYTDGTVNFDDSLVQVCDSTGSVVAIINFDQFAYFTSTDASA